MPKPIYEDPQQVEVYVDMVKDYDGTEILEWVARHLPDGSTLLELGMGPGMDLDLLLTRFKATGSDYSDIFLSRYRKQHPDADLLELNAITLATDRTFDAIFSNKVLIHLGFDDLAKSFARQRELVPMGGMLFHTFWRGEKVEHHHGMAFYYYSAANLREALGQGWEVVECSSYTEFDQADSLKLVARKVSRED
ncbi:class I SAM-dependent methyltransferase [Pontibacter sp. G13]|uniref:class I SAM-dependent methyltransferase n=1 Tax=Pontibacter sp. G13 TaxID=3074898 RepID=UPI002888FA3C|nr:class I SAM-dependent methyltransferase [Pontibacter sp. G13]WNJ19931.1 class I SAM-dependent methyltransferase [Pontibacter sp. G13]